MNKVCLIGRLTADPEVRYTQTNNTLVASFNLAVNRRFAKENEERQADFIKIVAWSKTGEFCSKYFKKGQQVGITGRIQTRNYEDENTQKHYITEIIAEEVYFADSKKEGENAFSQYGSAFADNNGTEFAVTQEDDELPFWKKLGDYIEKGNEKQFIEISKYEKTVYGEPRNKFTKGNWWFYR